MQRLVVVAPTSDTGKTSVTMGLTAFWRQAGKTVQVYKTGPDYIDPQFHTTITGRPCINLDPYSLDSSELREAFSRYRSRADILLIEAAVGLTNGIAGQGDRTSALEVAWTLDVPVLLLVAQGQEDEAAREIEAPTPEDRVRLTGILLNEGDKDGTASGTALPAELVGVRVYGCLPPLRSHELKSRHLGLVVPLETEEICRFARQMAEALRKTPPTEFRTGTGASAKTFRLGTAWDAAFSSLYPENLRVLTECGTEPVFFSPFSNCSLPAGLSGLWLPDGYPELYAEAFSNQISLRGDIRDAVRGGLPTVAECGGLMYLLESLEDMNGIPCEMAGALTGRAFRIEKLQRFGYIEVWAGEETLLFAPGGSLRGRESHYWDAAEDGGSCVATKANSSESWSCVRGNATLFAGYPHLYLANVAGRKAAARFAATCRAFRRSCEETTY